MACEERGVTPELESALARLPDRPGVYLMKDSRGNVIYVGKAQSLRSRVRSYWQKEAPGGEVHRIRSVIDKVVDLEYTLTDSISEALLLEGNLIKRFQPPFNVRLKDDKSYPYIKVTLADDFPRIERTRKLPQDGSRYFGPYASASSSRARAYRRPHPAGDRRVTDPGPTSWSLHECCALLRHLLLSDT